MMASKSREDSKTFDKFTCLQCDSTISLAPATKRSKPES
jgi:hypothetical protein